MAIAYVQQVTANNDASGTTLTTGAMTVTAGRLLVAAWTHFHDDVSTKGTPTIAISDSQGNTWTAINDVSLGAAGVSDGLRVGLAYAMNAAGGSTTFTFTPSANSWTLRNLSVMEYSGAATSSALDASATTAGSTSTNTTATFSSSTADSLAMKTHCRSVAGGTIGATIGGVSVTSRGLAGQRIGEVVFTSTQTNITSVVTDSNGSATLRQAVAVFKASGGGGALTSGTASGSATGASTSAMSVTAATGGTSPYTYQWYRSTSSSFTPGGGNIVSGATSTTLNDTGLSASTTYYYKVISTDNVAATVTSNEVSITTTSGTAAARNRVMIVT